MIHASRFQMFGSPSDLSIPDLPVPELCTGEGLVQVKASATNPSDPRNVAGRFWASLPLVPGRDYAGILIGGDGKAGQEVWGNGARFAREPRRRLR
jgi:NADPH2:quinone reductase